MNSLSVRFLDCFPRARWGTSLAHVAGWSLRACGCVVLVLWLCDNVHWGLRSLGSINARSVSRRSLPRGGRTLPGR